MCSLSAVASAITSAEASTIARLTYASSWWVTVMPSSGCRLQMPSTQTSARTWRSASTVCAPTVTWESLSSRPPISTTSTRGWAASASATGGELVSTVQSRSGRQPARELERRRPAVEQQHLGALQQRQRRLGEMRLRLGSDVQPLREAHRGGRGRQRAAVHALHEPAGGQLTQVPPDRVVGDAELDDELAGHDLPVSLEAGEDLAAAFGGQHSCGL